MDLRSQLLLATVTDWSVRWRWTPGPSSSLVPGQSEPRLPRTTLKEDKLKIWNRKHIEMIESTDCWLNAGLKSHFFTKYSLFDKLSDWRLKNWSIKMTRGPQIANKLLLHKWCDARNCRDPSLNPKSIKANSNSLKIFLSLKIWTLIVGLIVMVVLDNVPEVRWVYLNCGSWQYRVKL